MKGWSVGVKKFKLHIPTITYKNVNTIAMRLWLTGACVMFLSVALMSLPLICWLPVMVIGIVMNFSVIFLRLKYWRCPDCHEHLSWGEPYPTAPPAEKNWTYDI